MEYECLGQNVCCTENKPLLTCEEEGGIICSSGKVCVRGREEETSDLSLGETCCISGSCETPSEEPECERYGGNCRFSCSNDEEESDDYECDSGVCCFSKSKQGYTGIIIFSILIVLVVLGIVFKNKLRPFWFKIKSKFGKGKGRAPRGPGPPGFPPGSASIPQRPMPRRIIPQRHRATRAPPRKYPAPSKQTQSEFDDVLKKLKEIGK